MGTSTTTTTTTTSTTTTTTKAPTTIGVYSVHPDKYCHTGHGAHRIGITYPFQEGSPWKSGNKWSNASVHVQKNEANAEGCRADCDANADCVAINYVRGGECQLYSICPASSVQVDETSVNYRQTTLDPL